MPAIRNVTALLGPTNTGKTHKAVERMLQSPTGMIGLPLRLLAREVFDRIVTSVGAANVALITGEEKIVPPEPRYWVCTVEAMPSDLDVHFIAIDEVQLATDFERGHVFTDRILHRRGRKETMLLGAMTMRPLLEQLVPEARFETLPRLSQLTFAGHKKLSRLPRRSATVAFSAENVYGIAELIRRQRGGAAVVLGALSPRTRNAQVALYQNGDVDHIVATDAIGMGLNMDIGHVAFASTRKFDGFNYRELTASELGQVAGRAGRYLDDGTFGVTGEAQPFDAEMIDRLENHRFQPAKVMQWRNRNLVFHSLDTLRGSLLALPHKEGLTRAQPSSDIDALDFLSRDDEIRMLADDPEPLQLLWDVCQIPDYRNISGAEHANLVRRIFRFLHEPGGRIPEDWLNGQLAHCARTDGDIDTLSNRISHVRTWTFIANRTDWVSDAIHWQERARAIEDSLSDALHERLTQRFVDRRTAVLMRRLHQKELIMSVVEDDGAVMVEGECAGHMKGLRFRPAQSAAGDDAKPLRAAAMKAVADELTARAQSLTAAPDPDFTVGERGTVVWHGAPVATIKTGASPIKPDITLLADDELHATDRDAVQLRLRKFLSRHLATVLEPLVKMSEDDTITGTARGLAFRLAENHGVIAREDVAQDVKSLSQDERAGLRKHGVRFGAFHIFMPALLKPAATELRLMLWGLTLPGNEAGLNDDLPIMPANGLTSAAFDRSTPKGFYRVAGFRICGDRVVRIDMLERLADMIRDRVFWRPRFDGDKRPEGSVDGGGFTVVPDMMSLVGCSGDEFAAILTSLGYRAEERQAPPPEETTAADADAAQEAPAAPEAAPAAEATPATEVEATPAPVVEAEPAPEAEAEHPAETAATEEPAEPSVIQVWWPRDTGPFKRRPKPEGRRRNTDKRPPKKARDKRPPRQDKPRPDRKPVNPEDSPFAALQSLREEMTGKS